MIDIHYLGAIYFRVWNQDTGIVVTKQTWTLLVGKKLIHPFLAFPRRGSCLSMRRIRSGLYEARNSRRRYKKFLDGLEFTPKDFHL